MKIEYDLWRILNRLYFWERGRPYIVWPFHAIFDLINMDKSQLEQFLNKLIEENYLTSDKLRIGGFYSCCEYYALTELGRERAKDIQYELFDD